MKKLLIMLVILALAIGTFSACQEAAPTGVVFENVKINGVEIAIDAKAAPILSALGKEMSYSESPTCNYEGMDKVYVYSGFRIETYTKSGVDYIRKVALMDDLQTTPEGVTVGMSEADVLAKYGEPTNRSATAIRYSHQNGTVNLEISLSGGKVSYILYTKPENNG